MMVGRLLSYWEGIVSGAMLNFGTVRDDNLINTMSPLRQPLLPPPPPDGARSWDGELLDPPLDKVSGKSHRLKGSPQPVVFV